MKAPASSLPSFVEVNPAASCRSRQSCTVYERPGGGARRRCLFFLRCAFQLIKCGSELLGDVIFDFVLRGKRRHILPPNHHDSAWDKAAVSRIPNGDRYTSLPTMGYNFIHTQNPLGCRSVVTRPLYESNSTPIFLNVEVGGFKFCTGLFYLLRRAGQQPSRNFGA